MYQSIYIDLLAKIKTSGLSSERGYLMIFMDQAFTFMFQDLDAAADNPVFVSSVVLVGPNVKASSLHKSEASTYTETNDCDIVL